MGEKVVMLRSTPPHSERVQQVLTDLFSGTNTTNIQSLQKYMFVPMKIVGDENKQMIQWVLRNQQTFRKNVYHYIITNIWNITHQFQIST